MKHPPSDSIPFTLSAHTPARRASLSTINSQHSTKQTFMKTKILVSFIGLLSLLGGFVTAEPLGTAFTYQGQLTDGGQPANGSYDFKFTLQNAGPGPVAGPVTNAAVAVSNGLFTTTLDFGPEAFTGDARRLGIGVRTNGSTADFTPMAPPQLLTP